MPTPDCDLPQPPMLREGIRLFNSGEYFACHEVLEDLWRDEPREIRRLYQGILQVAVALYHLEQDNLRGAQAMLAKAVEHLRLFDPSCQGVNVRALLEDAGALSQSFLAGGPYPDPRSIQVTPNV